MASGFKHVYDPKGVKLFQMFEFDAGYVMGEISVDENWNFKVKPDESLVGESLYGFTPMGRAERVHNHKALSRQELEKLQAAERAERVELMRAAYENLDAVSDDGLEEMFGEGGVSAFIGKPKYV